MLHHNQLSKRRVAKLESLQKLKHHLLTIALKSKIFHQKALIQYNVKILKEFRELTRKTKKITMAIMSLRFTLILYFRNLDLPNQN